MTDNEILLDAIYTFGPNHQKRKAVEEMSELTKEIMKDMDGKGNLDHIAEEIADTEITLEQLKLIYNCAEDVERWTGEKLERLRKLIFEEKYGTC